MGRHTMLFDQLFDLILGDFQQRRRLFKAEQIFGENLVHFFFFNLQLFASH